MGIDAQTGAQAEGDSEPLESEPLEVHSLDGGTARYEPLTGDISVEMWETQSLTDHQLFFGTVLWQRHRQSVYLADRRMRQARKLCHPR